MTCNTAVIIIVYNEVIKIVGGTVMFKKSILIILIFAMIFAMSFTTFARDNSDIGKIEYVNIINPEVGESGKIISSDSLFISIHVLEDAKLVLDLVKIDTPIFNFEKVQNSVAVDLENKESAIEITSTSLSKEEIFIAYQNAQDNFYASKSEYFSALSETTGIHNVVDESSENFDPTYQLTAEDVIKLENVSITRKTYVTGVKNYNYWEAEYLKLFEKVILSGVELKVDSLIPYFEYKVDNIKQGNYKLIVKLKETNEVVKSLEFEIVTKKILTEGIYDEMFKLVDFFKNIID